ncbi:MAG: histidine--tRNA ligase [Candidatus Babeliaceae bacterium]|jgi:histidyl-tRNA synthetase
MINNIKGTHDIIDLSLFNFFITHIKKHLEKYNFSEISTPILEPVELFKRTIGQETDVISKEMYFVTSSGDEAICLRPEATASTVRAFYNNDVQEQPWKVFSYGPMFRHERPQKGRFRQFHQVTIEMLGAATVSYDVFLITLLDRFFHEILLLDSYALLINFLGCHSDRAELKKALHLFLEKNVSLLCEKCLDRKEKNILRVFDCKNETCQELYRTAPQTTDFLCATCTHEWTTVQQYLEELSVSYSHKPTLVRGLDYYDKTVFEFVSGDLGSQNAFCGGGRYDGLATLLGAKKPLPSLGAAIGIERILLMLEKNKDKLTLPVQKSLLAILPFSQDQHMVALLLADQLQLHGKTVEVMLDNDSVKSMMRAANKKGVAYCLLIGPDEQAAKTVTLKNMITGDERRVNQSDVVKELAI